MKKLSSKGSKLLGNQQAIEGLVKTAYEQLKSK